MNSSVVQNPVSDQTTKNQPAMLHILALGRKQIEEGKVIDHDAVVALLEAKDNESYFRPLPQIDSTS
jgi:hypothetical protein